MKISKVLKYKFRDIRAGINTFFICSKKNTYDAFGYYDYKSSVPVFPIKKNSSKSKKEKYIFPYSPKLLEHCVHNLSDVAKLEEAAYLDEFRAKCKRCVHKSRIKRSKKEWDRVIDELCVYLETFSKNNNKYFTNKQEHEM